MSSEALSIGQVAHHAGVNVQTLRYYERRGLLATPRRSAAGRRQYPAEVVRLIRFIKRAQELGFMLKEIEELLRLREDESARCGEVRATARTKIQEIDVKIDRLRAMKRALVVLEKSWQRP